MKSIISPLAIDLGAKNTGVVSGYIDNKGNPLFHGSVISVDDQISWSMRERNARRHHRRNIKRRKMAKRLLWLLLEKEFDIKRENISSDVVKMINGLINRRGFTFITADDNDLENNEYLNTSEELIVKFFKEYIPEIFHSDNNLLQQLDEFVKEITDKPDEIDFFSNTVNDIGKMMEEYALAAGIDKYKEKVRLSLLKKGSKESYKAIRAVYLSTIRELEGNKHRKQYLKDIEIDIDTLWTDTLGSIFQNCLTKNELLYLIGNINNLQLKVLRKYFNQPDRLDKDEWDKEKLRKLIWRWIESWHTEPGSEEHNNRRILQQDKRIHPEGDIIDFLTGSNPLLTIPPYEDQNNRRPRKCAALYLDPEKLDTYYPEWRKILQKIHPRYNCGHNMSEGLDDSNDDYYAILFQRYLDRSSTLDPFDIREVIDEKEKRGVIKSGSGYYEFKKNLGENLADRLYFHIASAYYKEIEKARQGLWHKDNKTNILKRCNSNPPHKKNIKYLLSSAILQYDFSPDSLDSFINECWNDKNHKVESKTIKSWCVSFEETRKKYGNSFAEIYRELQEKQRNAVKFNKEHVMDDDEKIINECFERSKIVAAKIGSYLKQSDAIIRKYNTPFSLSQLANILETDIHGFSKVCTKCARENKWRSIIEDEGKARAVRLSSDSIRPFDGMLARIIDSQAKSIAELKMKELKDILLELKPDNIVIPVCIEQNSFKFTYDLEDIKKVSRSRRENAESLLSKSLKNEEQLFLAKDKRIKKASRGICPYNGEYLDNDGEIDHIIPRSISYKQSGAVYNHEANLIYCSRKGNQHKKNRIYNIDDLNSSYLKKVFGTDNKKDIGNQIHAILSEIRGNFVFTELPEHVQDCIRHALFMPEYRQSILSLLETQTKAKVNGTQAYLVKRIIYDLRSYLVENGYDPDFRIIKISSFDISTLRSRLSTFIKDIEKQKQQPVYSHIIDATCVAFLSLYKDVELFQNVDIPTEPWSDEGSKIFNRLLPSWYSVTRTDKKPIVERSKKNEFNSIPIFKDGIFAENFIPLIIDKDGLNLGFNTRNMFTIEKNNDLWFNTLRPYLKIYSRYNEDTLNDLISKAGNSFIAFSFDKKKCLELLQRAGKNPDYYSRKKDLVNIINGIRYTTQRKDIRNMLYDRDKKELRPVNEKDFKINVNISGLSKGFGKSIKNSLVLPVVNEWFGLEKELSDMIMKNSDIDISELCEQVYKKKHFNNSNTDLKRAHIRYARKMSLPVVAQPSGGFRIKRESPDGQPVFQLVTAHGYAWGFDKELKEVAIHPVLKNSKNVSQADNFKENDIDEVIKMNQWREVEIKGQTEFGIRKILLAPGTIPRFYSKMLMSTEGFMSNLLSDDFRKEIGNNIFNLPGIMKKGTYKNDFFTGDLKKPRDSIKILSVSSEEVEFSYIVEGKMKKLYLGD